MPDNDIPAVMSGSTDYQLGILHQRANEADRKFVAMDLRMDRFGQQIQSVNDNINEMKPQIIASVKKMLDEQTDTLKPILSEKMVRDANLKAAAEQSERSQLFWQKLAAVVMIIGAVAGGIKYAVSEWPHPAVHVTISPPSNVTVAPEK